VPSGWALSRAQFMGNNDSTKQIQRCALSAGRVLISGWPLRFASGRTTKLRQRHPTRACSMTPADNVNRKSGTRLHSGHDAGAVSSLPVSTLGVSGIASTHFAPCLRPYQGRHLTAWLAVTKFTGKSRLSKYVPAWDGNNSPQVVVLAQRWYRLAGETEPQCLWCSAVLRGGLPAPCTRPELNGSGRLFLCRLPNARLDQNCSVALSIVGQVSRQLTDRSLLSKFSQCGKSVQMRSKSVVCPFLRPSL